MRFRTIFGAESRVNQLEAALLNKPLFAIRRKNTACFLPRPPSGQRGGSWVEPINVTLAQPRFFPTKGAAKGFLTQWLRGPVEVKRFQNLKGDEDYSLDHVPEKAKESRHVEDYEVVEVFWGVKG